MILQGEWRLRTLLMVLLALTTLVALASLLAVGGGLLLWQQPEVRRSSVALVNREAAQLAERMELLLGGLQRQMELAGTLVARSPRDLPVALFDALTGPGQSFDALYVADGSGVIEAVSLRPEMLIHRQELLGSDLSANRLYRLASERQSAVWSNKFLSAVSGDVAVGVAIPVGQRVLIGELSLTELLRTLQVATRDPRLSVWVIDRRGELVAETGAGPRLGPVNLLGLPLVRAAVAGEPLPTAVSMQGSEFYPGVARSDVLDWFFLVRLPAGLNNPEVRSTALLVLAALASSLLIGALLAPVFANRIARPIRAITRRARHIADDQPSGGWPRGQIKELNTLAVDLETMARRLQERQEQFRVIFNASPVPMAVVDVEGGDLLVDVNEAWVRQFGRSRESSVGRSVQALGLWADPSGIDESVYRAAQDPDGTQVWLLDAAQRRLTCEFFARPVVIGGRDLAIWVVQDATERRRIEDLIRTQNVVLEGVTRAQQEFMLETDPRRAFDRMLSILLESTGSEYGFIGEVLTDPAGQPYLKTHAVTNIAWDDASADWFDRNAPAGLEFRKLQSLFGEVMTTRRPVISNDPARDPRRCGLPPGHPPLLGFLGVPLFQGEQMCGMVGMANRVGGYDDSIVSELAPVLATCASLVLAYSLFRDRARGEERLRLALADKEVLLKEVYHRVKNNLQVVSSLLNLQGRRVDDPQTRRLLDDSANRVKSMALVHEQLYRASNLASIALPLYFQQLADNLGIVHRPLSARVPMVLEIADLTVGVERAIPLGLMINELVSNAYRHGYDADTAAGRIVIRLAARLDGRVGLEVRDDGRGLPSDFGAGRASTLGMQLVRTLAQQLGAELDWETGPEGTCFRIVFALDVRAALTESM